MADTFLPQINSAGRFESARADIVTGLRRYYLWQSLAIEELRARFHRTIFGFGWIVFTYFIHVTVLALIFGPMRGQDSVNYPEYLAFGFLAWGMISSGVTTGSTVFISAKGWIHAASLPYTVFIFKNALKELIPLGINLTLVVLIKAFLVGIEPIAFIGIAIAVPVFVFNFCWVSLLLGMVCARYRDIEQLIGLVMRLSFFMTPIIWTYEPGGEGIRNKIAIFNPFTHFMEIFRRPLMGEMPTDLNMIVVAGLSVFGPIVAFCVFAMFRRRLPFWL